MTAMDVERAQVAGSTHSRPRRGSERIQDVLAPEESSGDRKRATTGPGLIRALAILGLPLIVFIGWQINSSLVTAPSADFGNGAFGDVVVPDGNHDLNSVTTSSADSSEKDLFSGSNESDNKPGSSKRLVGHRRKHKYRGQASASQQETSSLEEPPMFDPLAPSRECEYLAADAVAARRASQSYKSGAKARVGLLTFALNIDPRARNASLANKEAYASRHGYDVIIGDSEIDPTRQPAWSKLSIMRKYLPEYDYIMWSDVDAIFMNMSIAIEDLVDSEHELFFSADAAGINSGVFIVHSSEWSQWWLSECWNQTWLVDGHHPFQFEQRAIQYLYNSEALTANALKYGRPRYPAWKEVRAKTKIVEPCALNTNTCYDEYERYPECHPWEYSDGFLLVHFAGKIHTWRSVQMLEAVRIAELRNQIAP